MHMVNLSLDRFDDCILFFGNFFDDFFNSIAYLVSQYGTSILSAENQMVIERMRAVR